MSRRRRRPPRPTCADCGELIEWLRCAGRVVPLDYTRATVGHRYAVRGAAVIDLGAAPGAEGRLDHRYTCTVNPRHDPNPADPRLGHDD